MAEPVVDLMSPSGDKLVKNEEGEYNWNQLYVLVLVFNVILVTIFFLLGHFFNHLGA